MIPKEEDAEKLDQAIKMYLYKKEREGLLSAEQVLSLFKQIEEGNDIENAKDKIIKANLWLVVSIAAKNNNHGLHIYDLIQDGNIGLVKAVENYKNQNADEFSTYAASLIQHEIRRSISEKDETVRLPVHMIKQINKVLNESSQLLQSLGREPSDEEIAERLNWPVKRVKSVKEFAKTSLDKKENSPLWGDVVADTNMESLTLTTAMFYEQYEEINSILEAGEF